jgi:molybdopterin converting factor small subunit
VRVEVRLFATLATFLPPDGRDGAAELEVPEGSTVSEITSRLGIPPDLARIILVNGRDVGTEALLAARDVVTIFPPLAGGARYASRGAVARGATSASERLTPSAAACSIVESISAPSSRATPLQ